LPPYSPDLNPIEQLFAKLKALLRKAAERSVDALWVRIGDILTAFKPDECTRYLAHAALDGVEFSKKQFGIKLDWTDASIADVEKALASMHRHRG
jgi:hypothetical protein